jgi:hypothetical protein
MDQIFVPGSLNENGSLVGIVALIYVNNLTEF